MLNAIEDEQGKFNKSAFNIARGVGSAVVDRRKTHCSRPPSGVDRLFFDSEGRPSYRLRNLPDGTQIKLKADSEEILERFGRNPELGAPVHHRKQKHERVALIPGDPLAIETVALIYRWRLQDGLGYVRIAKRLKELGRPTPGRSAWTGSAVCSLVNNPTYSGICVAFRKSKAKFARASRLGEPVAYLLRPEDKTAGKRDPRTIIRPAADWVRYDEPRLSELLPPDLREVAAAHHEQQLARHSEGYRPSPRRDAALKFSGGQLNRRSCGGCLSSNRRSGQLALAAMTRSPSCCRFAAGGTMTLDEALQACRMYANGHAVSRRLCRHVANALKLRCGVLPTPGTIGQVIWPAPHNFACVDVVCTSKPSVTFSFRGRPDQYAGMGLDSFMVSARPGTVRFRFHDAIHRFPALRAFDRAAQIAGIPLPPPIPLKYKKPLVGGGLGGSESLLHSSTSPEGIPLLPVPEAPEASPPPPPSPESPFGTFIGKQNSDAPGIDGRKVPEPESAHKSPAAGEPSDPFLGDASGGFVPIDIVDVELRQELARIVVLLAQRKIAALIEAAGRLRDLRLRAAIYPTLLPKLLDVIGLWRLTRQLIERSSPCFPAFPVPYESTEILPPGTVVPSLPAQLGSQRDALPPAAVVDAWLRSTFGSEDALREFCCFQIQEDETAPLLNPLLTFHRTPIMGSRIAPLYRERRIARPWDPGRPVDMAMLHDFILVVAVVVGKGKWTASAMRSQVPRLRPYLRSVPDEYLIPAATHATGILEGRGFIASTGLRAWKVRPDGLKVFDQYLGPVWMAACR